MRPNASPYRFYLSTLLGIAAVGLILQIASLGPLRASFWGFHLFAFVHPAVAVVGWACVALAAIAVLRPMGAGTESVRGDPFGRPWLVALTLATVCAGLFWLFRTEHLFLGDALPLKIDLAKGQDFHPRQPLTMWVQQQLFRFVGPIVARGQADPEEVALRSVAWGSVAAGFLFVLVAVALGRGIARSSQHTPRMGWLAALVILSQGYIQLFFGYVENYTYYALMIAVYIYLGLRYISGSAPLVLSGLALVLALALHLSAAVLMPSFLVLAVWGLTQRDRRRGALLDLAICAVVLLGVRQVFLIAYNYDLLGTLFDVSGRALGQKDDLIPGYMTSLRHARDFINEQFLIGPLGLFLFLPAGGFALAFAKRRDAATVFLLTLGLAYAAASGLAGDSNLGYARNWDLLAPAGICFVIAAVYFVSHHVTESVWLRRLLVFGLVISAVHTLPWIWINHNEQASFARLKALPLGLGRTEVVVANWYLRNGRREEATQWFRRAIAVNPNQGPAYAFLGMLFTEDERFEDARVAYARAVALRPDKPEYHHNYAMTLLELGRDDEALAELERLRVMRPDHREYDYLMADVLSKLGRERDLVAVNERLLSFAEQTLATDPTDELANVEAGTRLVLLQRPDEALVRFRAALATNPESLAGLFNLGSVLIKMGRVEEARPILQRFVELYPDHPNAQWARERIR